MRISLAEPLDSGKLAAEIRHAISAGKYSSRTPLPSYREMSKRYSVGIRTIRGALDILEQDGLLYRKERSGTFVRGSAGLAEKLPCASSIRCVNIIEDRELTRPAHVKGDYLAGYTEALEDHDVKMRFVLRDSNDQRFESLLSDRQAFEEQACLLLNMPDAELLRWLDDRGIPHVVQSFCPYSRWELPPHHIVSVNKAGGAAEATQYLLGLGHRRIGFIGFLPGCGFQPVVYEGYRAGMVCAGLDPCPGDMMNFATDEKEAAVGPALEYLRRKELPSAVLCQTDTMALGILDAARSLGISVPGDISVMGFNDQIEAEKSDPPLTTVSDPRRLLARTAMETLLMAAAGKFESYQSRSLECWLAVRKTTAPYAGG